MSYNIPPMLTESLNYNLPKELIAQKPAGKRSSSRLLVLGRKTGRITDCTFEKIKEYLNAGDCLVLNDTRVLAARFFGRRLSGGKIEGLFLEKTDTGLWEVMLKNSGKIKIDETILINGNKNNQPFCKARPIERKENGRWLIKVICDLDNTLAILDQIGFPPLPPYIKRNDDIETARSDLERYQTVYAKNTGAIAAPTAGMHFTDELITELKEMGVKFAFVTLHTGPGTFKPVTAANLEDHKIHSERYWLDEKNASIINKTRKNGNRIVAVGTTSVRTLETIAAEGKVKAKSGSTQLFIRPGYEFEIVDAIITNFHLPKSTLIALIGAFAGMDNTMAAYKHAIEKKYRFYSYGDSMMIIS